MASALSFLLLKFPKHVIMGTMEGGMEYGALLPGVRRVESGAVWVECLTYGSLVPEITFLSRGRSHSNRAINVVCFL